MIDTLANRNLLLRGGAPVRFGAAKLATVGTVAVLILIALGLFAPLLANRVPIVCRYEGQLHLPAFVEVVHNLPFGKRFLTVPKPFRFPTFNAKDDLSPDEFALWPPIRFGPTETSDDILNGPSRRHWLGTDEVGRDVAARLLHGTSVSVGVALGAMGLALSIGVLMGGLAGYFGGITDLLISRLIEIVICFPTFFFILSIMVWLGPGPGAGAVALVIGLIRWTTIARYVRAEFLRLRSEGFVEAARTVGAGRFRVLFRHMLPHALGPVYVVAAFGLADVVLIEAGLSWLGFGIRVPAPSWGNILRSGYEHMTEAPHLIYASCAAIFLSVLVFNLTGEKLRSAMRPGP